MIFLELDKFFALCEEEQRIKDRIKEEREQENHKAWIRSMSRYG
jgi:hypothetical protein